MKKQLLLIVFFIGFFNTINAQNDNLEKLRPLHGNFLQKKTKKYGYHLVIRILNCILGL